jgi:ribonuclease HI
VIKIYTDGSCKPTNPGPAGFGIVVVVDGFVWTTHSEYIGEATNNVAELSGIYYALKFLENRGLVWEEAEIITDSQYCIGVLIKSWNAKKNVEFIEEIRDMLDNSPNINIKWVKGHNGDKYNEMVDSLAGEAVDRVSSMRN